MSCDAVFIQIAPLTVRILAFVLFWLALHICYQLFASIGRD